jgi:YD repeat-containing protein
VDYGYDNLYRLTSETRSGTNAYAISYTYDNVGNRLTKDHDGEVTTYAYNIRDQLETETAPGETITRTYDQTGRMVSKVDNSGSTTYGWEDDDRLVSVAAPGQTVTYVYDATGIKVGTDDGTTATSYLVDHVQPYAQVIGEYTDSATPVAEYVYGLVRLSQDRAGAVRIYLADGQGSIRQLTDASALTTDTYDYYAFGELLASTGTTENFFQVCRRTGRSQ